MIFRKSEKIFFLILILILGALLRINHLADRSLWTDEFFTFFQATGHGQLQSFLNGFSQRQDPELFKAGYFKAFLKNDKLKNIKDVQEGLIKEDTHPPFYFILMHFWMNWFGDSILVVRFFSFLFGMLCIILAYKLGEMLFNEEAALFSALFVSISPFAVRYSQEARAYSLVIAIGLLSWLMVLKFERSRRNYILIILAILNCAGIFTHYFFVFFLFAQFLCFTVIYRKNNFLRQRLYLSSLFPMLFLFFWFMSVNLNKYNFTLTEWIFGYPITIFDKVSNIFFVFMHYFFAFDNFKHQTLMLFFGLSLLVYIASGLKYKESDFSPNRLFFCLIMLFVPLGAMLLIDIIEKGALLQQERFWSFSFLGIIPLAGFILSSNFLKRKVAMVILMLFMVASSFLVSKRQFGPAPQYLSGWINKESKGAVSAVMVYNQRSVVLAQACYLDDDIYILPVASREQLDHGFKSMAGAFDKVFIVRHFHRSDSSLMDQPFMETRDRFFGFNLKERVDRDDISVSEYVKS